MERESKIFGVGLSKTGTTSLTRALKMLGYKSCHFPKDLAGALRQYDALTDTPVAREYKRLDELYPNSRFILTIRDIDSWLESMKKHFIVYSRDIREEWILQLRRDLYHTEDFDRELMRESFLQYNESVKLYFGSRPKDLLVIDITNGEGWEVLCQFLSKTIPTTPFPQVNVINNIKNNNDN